MPTKNIITSLNYLLLDSSLIFLFMYLSLYLLSSVPDDMLSMNTNLLGSPIKANACKVVLYVGCSNMLTVQMGVRIKPFM